MTIVEVLQQVEQLIEEATEKEEVAEAKVAEAICLIQSFVHKTGGKRCSSERCPFCNGTGGLAHLVGREAKCGMCEGSGKIYFN